MYDECKVYGPYTRKDGRRHVILIYPDGGRKTVSYPKYLMEKHIDRYLDPDETVDHIDRDFTNDSIDNFRVLSRSNHQSEDVRRLIAQEFECAYCGKAITLSGAKLSNRITNSKRGKAGPFCSRLCSGKYGAEVQNRERRKLQVEKLSPEYTTLKNEGA